MGAAKLPRYSFVQNYNHLALVRNPIGVPFIELQSVDSTNNYAMRLTHEGVAQHGTAVFAHEQTAGKGQRHKQWLAQKGTNVLMSVVIVPQPLYTAPPFHFSMAIAVAACAFFKKMAGDDTKIKWPNDIYWCDRKAGGILIENVLGKGRWKVAVAGIGLNINQTSFETPARKAVSLKQITGTTSDTITLAKELCAGIHGILKKWEASPEAIIDEYHRHLYKKGEWVKLKTGPRIFQAQVKEVNAAGQLVTQHAIEEIFDHGAVEWLIE